MRKDEVLLGSPEADAAFCYNPGTAALFRRDNASADYWQSKVKDETFLRPEAPFVEAAAAANYFMLRRFFGTVAHLISEREETASRENLKGTKFEGYPVIINPEGRDLRAEATASVFGDLAMLDDAFTVEVDPIQDWHAEVFANEGVFLVDDRFSGTWPDDSFKASDGLDRIGLTHGDTIDAVTGEQIVPTQSMGLMTDDMLRMWHEGQI